MLDSGKLFIVATPIGNLGDITLRALEVLKSVDLIAAEDTRHSAFLLNHYGVKTRSISLHDHNEAKRIKTILDKLQLGKDVALISDAGTPLISDPGANLVREVKESGFDVVSIPGVSAAIAALSVAGLATDKFIFEGFLPSKDKQRNDRLVELKDETRTMVFYESPHRLLNTITSMKNIFGDSRYAVIAKELTKKFETVYGNSLSELNKWLLGNSERQKGEFVILITGMDKRSKIDFEVIRVLEILSKELSHKQAVVLTSKITGVNKNKLYKFSL